MQRPEWAANSQLLSDYYDTEWGFPVRDLAGVYERIVLEGFQAGLSWAIVLKKRPALRLAFAGFNPERVALFDDADVARMLGNPDIIRNERKIRAAITNAKATVALADDGIDLGELVWSFRPDNPREVSLESPSQSDASRALSRALKKHGFVFVGPVTAYALMQAIGLYEHRL